MPQQIKCCNISRGKSKGLQVIKLFPRIMKILNLIQINREDNLPKQFCYDCSVRIESSFNFITEAQKVDDALKNIVSRMDTSVIVEIQPQIKIDFDTNVTKEAFNNCSNSPNLNDILQNDSNSLHDNVSLKSENDDKNSFEKVEITIKSDAELKQIIGTPVVDEETDSTKIKMEENITDKKKTCVMCGERFATKKLLNRHMKAEHANSQYTCSECSKTYKLKKQLIVHMKSHILSTAIEAEEEIDTASPKIKIEETIADKKKTICPICRKSFATKKWFNRHMKAEHAESQYTCSECSKTYTLKKQLTVHMKSHTIIRPYICSICNMRFTMKSSLKIHMKIHQDDKQFLCYLCGWTFIQAGNLMGHMRSHTGEKPHKCDKCSFKCSFASSLRRHQRKHVGDRQFPCPECHKRFYDATTLGRHKRTHTGELPYKCPHCTQAFIDSWKRKTHLMRQHRLALNDIPKMKKDGSIIVLKNWK